MTIRKNSSIIMDETVNNLRRLFQVVNRQSKNEVFETGLTGPQLWALKTLSDEPENSITVSTLAEKMCLNSSTVVRILDVLEAKTFAQRVRSTHDRRIVYVGVTTKGRLIINQSSNVAQTMLINGLHKLSENKLNNLANGLSQLVNILNSEHFPHQQKPA